MVLARFSMVLHGFLWYCYSLRFPMGFARFSLVLPRLPSYGFTKDFDGFS